jgi:hypothetical protein
MNRPAKSGKRSDRTLSRIKATNQVAIASQSSGFCM